MTKTNNINSSFKTLLLIRHAKSSWDNPSQSDFERPLNERGKRDAPEMAGRLIAKKIKIDIILSSPAKRASRTARVFAQEYELKKDDILFKTELYGADERDFFDVIGKINNRYNNAALFSHNPGLTYFANLLTGTRIDNIPTCGVFAVRFDSKNWADFKDAEKEFWFFDYPKAITGE